MTQEETNKRRFFGLYNSVQLRLYSYLLAIVHNHNDAEDLLQETAIVLWDKFDEFQEGSNFSAWAVKIASFNALNFIRKNKRTKMFFKEDFYESLSTLVQNDLENVSERSEALRFCLKKLPDNSRTLLSMRYNKEISIKRISRITGRSANGLYQSFSRIINAMRECMSRYIAKRMY